jgi:hypothetical protein
VSSSARFALLFARCAGTGRGDGEAVVAPDIHIGFCFDFIRNEKNRE